MAESFRTRLRRISFNLFPAYRGTGAVLTYIADDWREIRLRLPLNLWTRNYVGTLYGGSIYGAVDPIYMIMLIRVLGPDYIVWDKAAAIHFRKPGRGTLYARFTIDEAEVQTIRELLHRQPSVDRVYHIDLVDADGLVCASVEKTLYIRLKSPQGEQKP